MVDALLMQSQHPLLLNKRRIELLLMPQRSDVGPDGSRIALSSLPLYAILA